MQKAKLDANYKLNLKQELTGFEIESNVDLAAFQGKDILRIRMRRKIIL